ncbi:hypothetical protein GCM10009117_10770 [Gangjinia marincola]|uniref:Tail specific protease domain-containing protein n=1 Tax=Gangjinia marincola TaxID=578463 RepID=A0ABN1MFK6_9FLAO
MKGIKVILLGVISASILTSCFKDEDDEVKEVESIEFNDPSNLEIEDFVWKGMNAFYLYKADSPNLANDRFSTNEEYTDYLSSFENADDLFFNDLVTDFDRFSFRSLDYRELEAQFAGEETTTGLRLTYVSIEGSSDTFLATLYVIPGSPADEAGLTRGTLFNSVDGNVLDDQDDVNALLSGSSFELGIATLNGNTISSTGETVTLNRVELIENPILTTSIIDVNGSKVGYLHYTSFVADFDDELNDAFAIFQAEGITELVIDVRYNGGGSVESAKDLSSMVTGQFNDELYASEQWNADIQAAILSGDINRDITNEFDDTIRTGESINSLGLNRLFVLAGRRSASASELLINSLRPYITVTHVGDQTVGKSQASITLYDSENFTKNGPEFNEAHFYVIQPLVLITSNANDETVPVDGLVPNILLGQENVANLGQLGDPNEPWLAEALSIISGDPVPPAPFDGKASASFLSNPLIKDKGMQVEFNQE